MNNRMIWLPLLLLTLLIPAYSQDAGTTISAKARQIHESALIIDTHADTPQRFLDENFDLAWGFPQPGRTYYVKTRMTF